MYWLVIESVRECCCGKFKIYIILLRLSQSDKALVESFCPENKSLVDVTPLVHFSFPGLSSGTGIYSGKKPFTGDGVNKFSLYRSMSNCKVFPKSNSIKVA